MIGSRIHLRLFIDGVEVPVSGAAVNFSEGQGSQCSATIIPIDEMHDIRPRGLVTLFYLDSKADDTKIQTQPGQGRAHDVARGMFAVVHASNAIRPRLRPAGSCSPRRLCSRRRDGGRLSRRGAERDEGEGAGGR